MFWEIACTYRIFWFQKIKQRLIRTVRGLNCLNSPVPLLLMQMCAQHVSLEELQIVSFQRSQEHSDMESQDKLQVAILWKLLIYTAHRRSTEKHACLRPPYKGTIPSVSRNYLQHSLKTKVCHSRKFFT